MEKEYRICNRCVMDSSDPDIQFDDNGFCNHCSNALKRINHLYSDKNRNKDKLDEIVKKVKSEGLGNKYDCLIGLSGGVDSSYLAYVLVKQFGIRPLAIHIDNGWNSEQAVSNIHNIVTRLNIDLITHVIDWNEFKELQKSFLRASVVDLELLSDHAILVVINKLAREHKIKSFLIGGNFQTESILPDKWFYNYKNDSKNIIDIYKQFGDKRKLRTYPFLNFFEYLFFGKKYGRYLDPLSYMDYNKDNVKKILIKELGWQDYGAKHHESFITRFYQSYILPEKFKIDKRRAHMSSLICSGQITRDDALLALEVPFFTNEQEKKESIEYFCKKLDLTIDEFNIIINEPRREHNSFKSYFQDKAKLIRLLRMFKVRNK